MKTEHITGVRRFTSSEITTWQKMEAHEIRLGSAIEKSEGGPLSAYFARFGKGETAELPAPYSEVWVVTKGALTIVDDDTAITAGVGDFLHVPTNSPGQAVADEDTELVCVSVPAH